MSADLRDLLDGATRDNVFLDGLLVSYDALRWAPPKNGPVSGRERPDGLGPHPGPDRPRTPRTRGESGAA